MKRGRIWRVMVISTLVSACLSCVLTGSETPAVDVDRPQGVGAKGIETGDVDATFDPEVTGVRLEELAKSVDNLAIRVGSLEDQVVQIRTQTAAIATSTETTLRSVSALTSHVATGTFSGSGIYAVVALALVLAAQLVGVVLWWKLRRDVKRNAVTPSRAT